MVLLEDLYRPQSRSAERANDRHEKGLEPFAGEYTADDKNAAHRRGGKTWMPKGS